MRKNKMYDTGHPMPMAMDDQKTDYDKDHGPAQMMEEDKPMMAKDIKRKMGGDPEYAKKMQRQLGNARLGRIMYGDEKEEPADQPAETPEEQPTEK